ncbi:hypothetical protein CGLO_13715 [Colletotrichum gloeosporioides Cg-14]|uniref:Uncharacterized protein n=1 Tax=Colletotrichum gloeosporioides (strain Cg-14) TaxID=1237896 RepID=T0L6I3_COLGC|nr:hypothetical protein CGLO_13715 [Colletotrichum gloeosporioides Cg-14]
MATCCQPPAVNCKTNISANGWV